MLPLTLHSRPPIEAHLRRRPSLYIYELGDLDDFFFPYTTWYAFQDEGGQVEQLALLYTGSDYPVLLAQAASAAIPTRLLELLRSLLPFLPRRFYAHLAPGLELAFANDYTHQSHGLHHKMALAQPSQLSGVDVSQVAPLTSADLPALQALYAAAYPGNWFDPRMLATGCYFGVRREAELVCAAGVHVYSPAYRVAALGNIVTHPAWRGRGLATAATACLCQHLLPTVDHLGLNVKADNLPAIAAYHKLGFEIIADYEEIAFESL